MLPHFSDHLEFALKLLRHNLQPTLLARLVGVRAELITSPISFRPLHRSESGKGRDRCSPCGTRSFQTPASSSKSGGEQRFGNVPSARVESGHRLVTAYGGFTPYAAGVVAGCRCGRYLGQSREVRSHRAAEPGRCGIRATPRHHDRDPHPPSKSPPQA
jgi:hypothetical protein